MKFSEDFIEKVREANDLVDLIGRHTNLKQGGRSLMGLCPFPSHQEKSPSFSVSPDKQLYHCFGCGKSGNIFSFLRDYYGYSFPESVEYLAKRSGIPIPAQSYQNEGYKQKLSDQKSILKEALVFFKKKLKLLPPKHPVHEYLKSRGMGNPELIEHLSMGWAPDAWSELTDHLMSRGASLKAAEELGLIKSKKQGAGHFDLFRARLMFPVFSFSGEVLGFGGRVLGDEKPKYLNSPESPVFKKSKILYGQNWASPHIRQFDEAIIVEGYTDWISLHAYGIKNSLATMGTALTQEHAKRIKRWCKRVVCLFDGDEAGKRASERALTHLLSEQVLARGVFLPQGEDPDSFLKRQGVEKMKLVIQKSEDLFIQLLDQKLEGYEGKTHEKIEALSWSTQILAHLPASSPILAIYLQEVESRLRIGPQTLKFEMNKAYKAKKEGFQAKTEIVQEEKKDLSEGDFKKLPVKLRKNDPELIAFSLAIESEKLVEELSQAQIAFSDPGILNLWQILQSEYGQKALKSGNVEGYLASFCSNPGALTLTLEKPYCNLSDVGKAEVFRDCLQKINKRHLNAQAKKLTKNIGQNADEEALRTFLELQKKKRELNKI